MRACGERVEAYQKSPSPTSPRAPSAHAPPRDTHPSRQARRSGRSSIGAPARAHLPQRHRLHLRHVLHARTRGRCKKTLVIQNSHSLLIRSAGKTPPTCDEIVDLRHSACGHNNPIRILMFGHQAEPSKTFNRIYQLSVYSM